MLCELCESCAHTSHTHLNMPIPNILTAVADSKPTDSSRLVSILGLSEAVSEGKSNTTSHSMNRNDGWPEPDTPIGGAEFGTKSFAALY
ncbi:MAG: hypothetical protein JWR35_3797 [Marmoricola sp.]|nr:hypothetical protein [Marmoricola sp.]